MISEFLIHKPAPLYRPPVLMRHQPRWHWIIPVIAFLSARRKTCLILDTATGKLLWPISLPFVNLVAIDLRTGTIAVDSTPVISPKPVPVWMHFIKYHLPFLGPYHQLKHGISIIKLS